MKTIIKYITERILKYQVIIGFTIACIPILYGIHQYHEQCEWNKKAVTMEYLKDFGDILEKTDTVLINRFNLYSTKKNTMVDTTSLKCWLDQNPQYRIQITKILGYLNQLAIGFNDNFYDEHIVWLMKRTMIINIVNGFKPYFKLREKELGYGICAQLTNLIDFWEHNHGIYKRWEKEKNNNLTKREKELENYARLNDTLSKNKKH